MPGSLWNYSLEIYRRPGVQDACLKLQDDMGADVNLLMYCCWRGAMADGEMGALLTQLAELSESAAKLRKKVAAMELEAEKLQQAMMSRHAAKHVETDPPSPQAAGQNLTQYFERMAAPADRDAQNALAILVRAAFPDGGEDDVDAAIAKLSRCLARS